MNGEQVVDILMEIRQVIDKNKYFLSELDAAIGDGDHGVNMSRGFDAIAEKLKDNEDKDIGSILKKAGMTLVAKVGGASGPLYGTAFIKAAAEVSGREEIDINDFIKMMEAALAGIKMRGKAKEGEKTMIDSISPALKSLKLSVDSGSGAVEALEKAEVEALRGVEETKNIIATKGRASYLGERSIGHQDAGATSSYLIIKTICNKVKKIS